MNYILDGRTPIVERDLLTWAKWFEHNNRIVKSTYLPDGVHVSTVFLGIDHAFAFTGGAPILFETMIFGGEHDDYQERYSTWEEAEQGHQRAIELIFS
jgi:hypothetical protein